MRLRRSWWVLALVLGAGAGAGACRGGARDLVQTIPAPDEELQRAMALFRQGEFRRAQTIFQRVAYQFAPGQPELAQARYFLAETYFQTGDRALAATEFRKVADEFPQSEYAPLALLRAGDANLRMWRRPELDPTPGEAALATYQELAGRYPDSEAAARARAHVRRLQNQFAEKTYKTGMFYLRRKAFDSAILYFKDVIANYPAARRAPDALVRLVEAYREIGYTEEVQETCAHLRRFYPQAAELDRRCPPADPPAPASPVQR